MLELEHLILEIAPAFDLEETYMNEEDAPLLSPFGLQMRVHAPFLYNPLQPALFYRLLPQEEVLFQPGMLLHIGKMKFLLERFQTGAHDDTGFRFKQEDAYIVQHDLGLDQLLKASFFAVIDGHGGDWCASYLK